MRIIEGGPLPKSHPDYPVVKRIELVLVNQAGSAKKIADDLPAMIRKEIEKVIDTANTGRISAEQLEKTEKTYIGTRIEILFRNYFQLPKGKLDLKIEDLDVDIKNTIRNTWMIPREAVDKPCLLVSSDEAKGVCHLGILIAKPAYLTMGHNQDKKLSVSAFGFKNIHWLFANKSYPVSFWAKIGESRTKKILLGPTGNERIAQLFREVQRQPIHRDVIQATAQQKDYMKRLRKNGGARDILLSEGIVILSGNYDKLVIGRLKLGRVGKDEFISIKPISNEEAILLKEFGLIGKSDWIGLGLGG